VSLLTGDRKVLGLSVFLGGLRGTKYPAWSPAFTLESLIDSMDIPSAVGFVVQTEGEIGNPRAAPSSLSITYGMDGVMAIFDGVALRSPGGYSLCVAERPFDVAETGGGLYSVTYFMKDPQSDVDVRELPGLLGSSVDSYRTLQSVTGMSEEVFASSVQAHKEPCLVWPVN